MGTGWRQSVNIVKPRPSSNNTFNYTRAVKYRNVNLILIGLSKLFSPCKLYNTDRTQACFASAVQALEIISDYRTNIILSIRLTSSILSELWRVISLKVLPLKVVLHQVVFSSS